MISTVQIPLREFPERIKGTQKRITVTNRTVGRRVWHRTSSILFRDDAKAEKVADEEKRSIRSALFLIS